jgi:hypothetical protein
MNNPPPKEPPEPPAIGADSFAGAVLAASRRDGKEQVRRFMENTRTGFAGRAAEALVS